MAQKNSSEEGEKGSSSAAFVKVCMDGAPYLRKVDLKMYKSYQELSDALGKMFSSFTMGRYCYIFCQYMPNLFHNPFCFNDINPL